MRKNLLRLLLLAVVLVVGIGQAAAELADGTYYIKNVASGLYLTGANDWGTRASVGNAGALFEVAATPKGGYSIKHTLITVTKKFLGENLYTDSDTPEDGFVIESAGDGIYTISCKGKYVAQGTTKGTTNDFVAVFAEEVSDAAKWKFLTKDQAITELKNATESNPLSATFLISNPGFNRNTSTSDWRMEANNKNLCGGKDANKCAESWRSSFTLSQKITVPNGYYKVRAQAAMTEYTVTGKDLPVVYANDATTTFMSMTDGEDSMDKMSDKFSAEKYYTDWSEIATVTDKSITVGVKGTRTDTWCIWDNIQLTYYGPLDLTKLAKTYDDALSKAQEILNSTDPISKATSEDLQKAIAAYSNADKTNEDALLEAINALNEAIAKAEKSAALYKEIKKNIDKAKTMFAGVDATSIDEKYNNGEYADDYNPNQIFAEFSQLAIAQTEAVAGADFTGVIINPSFSTDDATGWTIEKKGSEWQNAQMKPGDGRKAYEYWTGKASAAGFDFHQTIAGLPAGFYTISAQMLNSTNDESGAQFNTAGQVGVYIKDGASENFAPVTVNGTNFNNYTTKPFYVNGNSDITIGVKNNTTMTARWFAVDDFVLTYVNTVDGFIAQLKNALTEEEAQAQFEEAAKSATTNSEMEAAFQAAIRTQTTEGADYTGTITNPSFETGNTAGWTFEASVDYGAKLYNMDGKDGNYVFNIWDSGNAISQTIQNLPKGTYTLKAVAASDDGNIVLLTANGSNVEIEATGADNGIEGELTFAVTDGKAIIGAEGANKAWYKVDNFRLEYAGAITEVSSISELIASKGAVNFNMAALEVLNAGEDSIVVQDTKGEVPAGIQLKGTKDVAGANNAAYGKAISGQIFGTFDAATRTFNIDVNSGNNITAANAEATINEMELVDALKKDNAYLLTMIEMATIVEEDGAFYAKKNEDKIQLDKRLAPSLMLYDGEAVLSIKGVTFLEGDQNVLAPMSQSDIRSNKAEAADGAEYAQGESVTDVNGVIMTFGGTDDETDYKFAAVDQAVNKLGTKTEGINQFPVDDNDKAYDPEQKNLPTKGTYYVFTPTKDGKLDVTVDLENGKKLYVTEEAEALKDFNGITTVKDNLISFDVKAMKTYYVFANETNLGYYGFSFTLADAYARGAVKDIATFKLLPQDNEDGDTLKLNDAVVTYMKGDNVFVEDASGAINFYKTGIQFYVGQKLNGSIIGQNHEEYYMPQLLKTADTKYGDFKVTEKITPEAKVISIADAPKKENLARFVKLENLVVSNDAKGFKILLDEETGNSVRIEDRFNVFYELNKYVESIEGIIAITSDSAFVFCPTSKEGVVSSENPSNGELADGKFVFKNVATGLFWGAGNNWGTRASLLDYSEFQTLAKQPDGTYTMETQVSNGGTNYFFGGDYMDGQPVNLTITPVAVAGEEIVDFDGSFYHNWSEVSGTATDNGSANGGVKLNEEVGAGGVLWGNLSGAVPFKDYANITDYSELRFEGTPGATLRLMCNRVVDEGPIFEIQPKIGDDGKLTVNISDLKFLNGGTPCDFVCLQSIKIPWGGTAATLTSIKLVKSGAEKMYYTVANGDQYFGYSTAEDAPYVKNTAILGKGLAADDKNALWEIAPATTEALAVASETNPVDATFLILNPNFGRNNRNGEAWTMEAGNKNMSGGTNENRCAESWRSAFTLSQELNVPNGVYALNAQAALTDYADLYDGNEYPVVYANEETAPFQNMEGSDRGSNMSTLSAAFANGNYKVNTIYVTVTDGKLTIGAKGTRTDTWCIWDNFQLKYYGTDANIENLKGGAESKELDELRKKATELLAEVEIEAVKTALQNALNATANVSGADAIKAAIATLTAAVDLGEASVTGKKVLPKMKELIDATNVYTEEAYNEYYGTWLTKYQAGTLTKAEANGLQDPTVVTGWHAQITVDNFLLSAWDTNPDFNNAAYYINSWSVEGDNDGSDFHVPFFEYWTGDDASLGEKTLTATMEGLAAGDYNVSAWVRVRMKNGAEAPAYGINLQVNDGATVDVAAGTQIGDSQFFLDNFTATGTVGADGVLYIKFNVAEDNNISWLSFKNVKFEKVGGEITDDGLIEIPQDQGKDLDTFARTELVEGADYNTYTATEDLQVAFKMFDIDVKGCDYVVVKFAEPVSAGWSLAFWGKNDQSTVAVEAGSTEYKYVFADDPKCAIENDILPQITMLTLWGAQKPLIAKVTGVYKHKVGSTGISSIAREVIDTDAVYNLRGQKMTGTLKPGLYIKNGKKVVIK